MNSKSRASPWLAVYFTMPAVQWWSSIIVVIRLPSQSGCPDAYSSLRTTQRLQLWLWIRKTEDSRGSLRSLQCQGGKKYLQIIWGCYLNNTGFVLFFPPTVLKQNAVFKTLLFRCFAGLVRQHHARGRSRGHHQRGHVRHRHSASECQYLPDIFTKPQTNKLMTSFRRIHNWKTACIRFDFPREF